MTKDEFNQLAKKRFAEIRQHAKEKNGSVVDIPREIECIDVEVVNPYLPGKAREYFNLNEEVLEKAEREGKMLRFTWDQGSSMFSPAQWRNEAQLSLHVFKFRDKPMRLWGNYLIREQS